jgi:hypothetical protein
MKDGGEPRPYLRIRAIPKIRTGDSGHIAARYDTAARPVLRFCLDTHWLTRVCFGRKEF